MIGSICKKNSIHSGHNSILVEEEFAELSIASPELYVSYLQLGKVEKGIVIRYLMKVSGYSRQQVTRLIGQYRKTGYIKHNHANVPAFKTKYSKEDIRQGNRIKHRDLLASFPGNFHPNLLVIAVP